MQCSWPGNPAQQKPRAMPAPMSWSWCTRPSARPCGSCCWLDCRRSRRWRSRSPGQGRRRPVWPPVATPAHYPRFPAERDHEFKSLIQCLWEDVLEFKMKKQNPYEKEKRTTRIWWTYSRVKHVGDSVNRTVQHQPSDEEDEEHHVGKDCGKVHHLRFGKRSGGWFLGQNI